MSSTPDYYTMAALEGARRGLRSEATLYLGRHTHASSEPSRFAEDVAALVDYLEYEVKRRERAAATGGTGAPTWTNKHWGQHHQKMNRLRRILAHHLVTLADSVESGTLTIAGISQFVNTGHLETEEPTRKPAKRPPRKRVRSISEHTTAA